jgi:hypothetical protein
MDAMTDLVVCAFVFFFQFRVLHEFLVPHRLIATSAAICWMAALARLCHYDFGWNAESHDLRVVLNLPFRVRQKR